MVSVYCSWALDPCIFNIARLLQRAEVIKWGWLCSSVIIIWSESLIWNLIWNHLESNLRVKFPFFYYNILVIPQRKILYFLCILEGFLTSCSEINNDQSSFNESRNYLINFNTASVLLLTLCSVDLTPLRCYFWHSVVWTHIDTQQCWFDTASVLLLTLCSVDAYRHPAVLIWHRFGVTFDTL